MTMPQPSTYRGHCTQCGFETHDFAAGDNSGYFDPRTKNYTRLRVWRRYLLCRSCGTLRIRQEVYADPPLLPVVVTIGAWFLCVWVAWGVSNRIIAALIWAVLLGSFALLAIRALRSWFEKNVRTKYTDWITSVESLFPARCPTCDSVAAIEPTRARTALPCPSCHEVTQKVDCTFHGWP